jgi:hypothetical protein
MLGVYLRSPPDPGPLGRLTPVADLRATPRDPLEEYAAAEIEQRHRGGTPRRCAASGCIQSLAGAELWLARVGAAQKTSPDAAALMGSWRSSD